MIKKAKFITSVADKSKIYETNAPEFAFAGKSNVGKSSLINYLTGQSKLAKTSSEPGRTRLLNYFEINDGQFYFVDLPGYGYAKVSKEEKIKWGDLIETYLKTSENLKNVFVLLDIRHEPSADDLLLISFLFTLNIPFTIIATKADKLSKMQTRKAVAMLSAETKVGADNIIVTSVTQKKGREEVEKRIGQFTE
ncbi:probable GTP-binding protein EngB [Acidaminococcus sp. CAG:917]|nr:probable GTP-binding protein EngB [Acidaminococcus sp. CAG:917]